MKQLKFLMVAPTLLMGVSFTSCLNSDDNYDRTQGHFVRVKGGYASYFEDIVGNKLFPTAASLINVEANSDFKMSSTNFAFITYTLVEDEGKTKAETGMEASSYSIELLSGVAYDAPMPILAERDEDMENVALENAPIVSLIVSGSPYVPFLYDEETLFLPIFYQMENKVEQQKQHKLNLVCSLEGITSESTDITFYVRHDCGTDKKKEAMNVAYSGYDIRMAVERFKAITMLLPRK